MGFLLLVAAAAGAVTVPVGKTTTLVVLSSPRVNVPAGPFRMGASTDELKMARGLCADELRGGGALLLELGPRCGTRYDAEAPQAEVWLPAFAIDRTEVTVADYKACVKQDACRPAPDVGLGDDGRLPVERVTHDEAAAYCAFRKGRLPTEAEWEKAARGPGRRIWPWGNEWQDRRGNRGRVERATPGGDPSGEADTLEVADGFAARAPVGSFPAGASLYGVLDAAGNVWEWTATIFARDPPQSATRFDPRGPMLGNEWVARGGSYRSPPSDLRVTRRLGLSPSERVPGVGFRCAYDDEKSTP